MQERHSSGSVIKGRGQPLETGVHDDAHMHKDALLFKGSGHMFE